MQKIWDFRMVDYTNELIQALEENRIYNQTPEHQEFLKIMTTVIKENLVENVVKNKYFKQNDVI